MFRPFSCLPWPFLLLCLRVDRPQVVGAIFCTLLFAQFLPGEAEDDRLSGKDVLDILGGDFGGDLPSLPSSGALHESCRPGATPPSYACADSVATHSDFARDRVLSVDLQQAGLARCRYRRAHSDRKCVFPRNCCVERVAALRRELSMARARALRESSCTRVVPELRTSCAKAVQASVVRAAGFVESLRLQISSSAESRGTAARADPESC